MVTKALTENIELTAIECYDGHTHFKKCGVDYVNNHRKEQLSDLNGQIISGWNIKKIRPATWVEFFEHIVYPTLPYEEKEIYDSIKSNVPEDKIEKVWISNILFQIEQKKRQEKYYIEQKKEDEMKLKINDYLSKLSNEEYHELEKEAIKMVKSEFCVGIQIQSYIRFIIKEKISLQNENAYQ